MQAPKLPLLQGEGKGEDGSFADCPPHLVPLPHWGEDEKQTPSPLAGEGGGEGVYSKQV